MSIIQLKSVTVKFADVTVLSDVDLEIFRGETFVIIGPSGEGKTTLLKTLSGLVTPRNGEIFVEQKAWSTLGVNEQKKWLMRTGMLFQKNALFDSLTCGENIAFPLRETTSLSEPEIATKVEYFLEAVGLSVAKDLYPDEISGGMQKRLGIARALALDPEVIFYDDPTAGLDPITSKKIIELIIQLRNQKKSTVIAVTNDMNRAWQMADRIGMVIDGKLVVTGSPEQTKQSADPRVQQFIHGKAEGPLTAQI